jgi:hypothetical protein
VQAYELGLDVKLHSRHLGFDAGISDPLLRGCSDGGMSPANSNSVHAFEN